MSDDVKCHGVTSLTPSSRLPHRMCWKVHQFGLATWEDASLTAGCLSEGGWDAFADRNVRARVPGMGMN